MGVPRLFPWLIRTFPSAVRHFRQGEYTRKVEYLYIDANGLLHSAAQDVFHYGANKKRLDHYANLTESAKCQKVYSLFFDNIIQITQVVVPTKVLYIAIDGPAPLAKQAQQRERRFVAAKSRVENTFDSCSITPGTVFMHKLTQYIKYAIRKEMNTYSKWRNIDVIFSPPTVPGEGEHKLMNYIRSLPKKEREHNEHCLFGPDGDLIMLTLAAHVDKMWLFREDQFNPGYLHLLDMGLVRRELPKALSQNPKIRTLNDITDDFIVEGFFVGNDFLPKIQMFHLLEDGLEFMLNTYRGSSNGGKTNFLTVDSKFNLVGFKVFISTMAASEKTFLLDQVTTTDKRKQPPESKFRNETLLKCITATGELDFNAYRKSYYVEKCKIDIHTELEGLCRDYLRSFVWIFEYYVHGLPSWKWAYRHHYAPLMVDFNEYIQNLSSTEFKSISSFDLETPSHPFEQLLSVLPQTSARLLPKPYQKFMLDSNMDYYPKSFHIDYEGKLQEFQGVAILPFVDYKKIHDIYEKITTNSIKNSQKYIRNCRGTNALFKYDLRYTAQFEMKGIGKISNLHVRKYTL